MTEVTNQGPCCLKLMTLLVKFSNILYLKALLLFFAKKMLRAFALQKQGCHGQGKISGK